jgi:hypothetical protein
MKKSELKNIIKECVKEVIFEEGVLSGIITEVAQGLQTNTLAERSAPAPRQSVPQREASQQLRETKQQVISAITSNSYDDVKKKFTNPELFEGTKPIVEQSSRGGSLSGVAPGDPGVDISNIPGFGNWGTVAKSIGK